MRSSLIVKWVFISMGVYFRGALFPWGFISYLKWCGVFFRGGLFLRPNSGMFYVVCVMCLNRLTIGTMFSNMLMYTYEMKSVDDPAASDRTLSLGYFYFPFLRARRDIFFIISPNFLFLASNTSTDKDKWPQRITINSPDVLTSQVQNDVDQRVIKAPRLESGLLKVAFVNRSVFADQFYTPFFNLRQMTHDEVVETNAKIPFDRFKQNN